MKPHASGVSALLEIASSELDHQLNTAQLQKKDDLLSTLNDYLLSNIQYEDAFAFFKEINAPLDTLDKLREIRSVEEAPLPSNENLDDFNNHKKSRPWSNIEDIRLLAGILRYGLENWSTVAMFVGNDRSRAQCSQRWSRGLNPRISKDTWSSEEDNLLLNLIQQYGDKSWTKIASMIGNRSDVQCRYHYHQINKNSKTLNFGSAPPQRFNSHYRNLEHIPHNQLTRNPPRFSLPTVTLPYNLVNQNNNDSNNNVDSNIMPMGINPNNSFCNRFVSPLQNDNVGSQPPIVPPLRSPSLEIPRLVENKYRSISAGAVGTQQHFAGPSQLVSFNNSSDFDLEEINIDGFLRRFQ